MDESVAVVARRDGVERNKTEAELELEGCCGVQRPAVYGLPNLAKININININTTSSCHLCALKVDSPAEIASLSVVKTD